MKNSIIDPIADYLKTYVQDPARKEIIMTGKETTGKTRESIKTIKTPNSVHVEADGHIAVLEHGTGPKDVKVTFDVFWPIIQKWTVDKGMFSNMDDALYPSYGLARKIMAVGTVQYVAKEFINIFSEEVLEAKKRIPEIARESVQLSVHEIIQELKWRGEPK